MTSCGRLLQVPHLYSSKVKKKYILAESAPTPSYIFLMDAKNPPTPFFLETAYSTS